VIFFVIGTSEIIQKWLFPWAIFRIVSGSEMNSGGTLTQPEKLRTLGIRLLGIGTVSAGILDLLWRDFDSGHQPIDDLRFAVPGRTVSASVVGLSMALVGTIVNNRRTMRAGAWGIAVIYGVVGLFSLPLFHSMVHKYGFHITLVLGIVGRILQQYIVVAGCAILLTIRIESSQLRIRLLCMARSIIGVSSILFGLAHLVNPNGVMHMIPGWFPLSPRFWVVLSGIAFILTGVAILSGVSAALAARLLALMLLIFEAILIPLIIQHPGVHEAWALLRITSQ